MQISNRLLKTIVLMTLFLSSAAFATDITLVETKHGNAGVPQDKVLSLIKEKTNMNDVGTIKAQVIFNEQGIPDHILVFKLSNKYLEVMVDRINIDSNYNFISLTTNYKLTEYDTTQRAIPVQNVACPDSATQFIVFAPFEQGHTVKEQQLANEVADIAQQHNLKTVRLLLQNATRQNYLNYMSCPNLVGNLALTHGFTDGSIMTYDDSIYITPQDITDNLSGNFKYKVTTIWAACLVFASQMAVAMIEDANAQKFISGITRVPIDAGSETAACTMKTLITVRGIKIADAFHNCWKTYHQDPIKDKWGMNIDGFGSDYFAQIPLVPSVSPVNHNSDSSNSGLLVAGAVAAGGVAAIVGGTYVSK